MIVIRVGCHVSIAGSIERAVDRAQERTCDTFQIFTRNPRGWRSKDLFDSEISGFHKKVVKSGIDPVVAHMPYLPNLASPNPEVYEKSVHTLAGELERCDRLGIPYLVTHLGSHLGDGLESGLTRLVGGINRALKDVPGDVMLLLENTAGTANSVGGTFADIRAIMDGISDQHRIGICFDTCHGFAAGYELRTPEGIAETIEMLDAIIGTEHLRIVHLNDCKGDCGSHLDRHEHIGRGMIGEDGFRHILKVPLFRSLPLICETPVDARRDDIGNITRVRELAGGG